VDSSALPSQPSCEVLSPRSYALHNPRAASGDEGQRRSAVPPLARTFRACPTLQAVMYRRSSNHLARRVGSLPAVATHPSLRNALILLAVYCVIILRNNQQDTLGGALGCMYSSANAEGDESRLQGLPLHWLSDCKGKAVATIAHWRGSLTLVRVRWVDNSVICYLATW